MADVSMLCTVTRVKNGGVLDVVEERTSKDGRTFRLFATVFPRDPHEYRVGDRVRVSGLVGAEAGSIRKRDGVPVVNDRDGFPERFANLLVRFAQVLPQDTPHGAAMASGDPGAGDWASDGSQGVTEPHSAWPDMEMPF